MRRLAPAVLLAAIAVAAPAVAQERYMGEVFAMATPFCPRGSLPADGRVLQVSANQALFALLGNIYGGDSVTTFALPDLRGRSPVHAGRDARGAEVRPGQVVPGAPSTLTDPAVATLGGLQRRARGPENPSVYRQEEPLETPGDEADRALEPMAPDPAAGASLGVFYCIAVEGIFPSRN